MATATNTPSAHHSHCFDVPLSDSGEFQVDREAGVIRGISLITAGITARGHDLEVDDTTLAQMLACAEKKKKLPVKWNHKSGADAVSGYLKNFRVVGKKLKGDWHLLKSHERYDHALELATEMPESLGLSVSFSGKDEEVDGRKYARCTNLVSADLVATPAANPDGMFEAQVDTGAESMANQTPASKGSGSAEEPSLRDVLTGITALNTRFTEFEQRLAGVEEFHQGLQEGLVEFQEGDEGEEGEPTNFDSMGDALTYLEERLQEIEHEGERRQSEAALQAFEERVEELIELNETLANQNRVMAQAIREFNSQSGEKQIVFSASAQGELQHEFVDRGEGSERLTEFEAKVAEKVAGGMSEADAMLFCVKNHGDLYSRYLNEVQSNVRTL